MLFLPLSPWLPPRRALSAPPPAGPGGVAPQGAVITVKAGSPDKAPEEEPGDGLPTLCLKQVYPKYTKLLAI